MVLQPFIAIAKKKCKEKHRIIPISRQNILGLLSPLSHSKDPRRTRSLLFALNYMCHASNSSSAKQSVLLPFHSFICIPGKGRPGITVKQAEPTSASTSASAWWPLKKPESFPKVIPLVWEQAGGKQIFFLSSVATTTTTPRNGIGSPRWGLHSTSLVKTSSSQSSSTSSGPPPRRRPRSTRVSREGEIFH